jgi:hypothetical protein
MSSNRRRRTRGPRTATPLVAALLLLGVFAGAIGLGQLLGVPLPSLALNLGLGSGAGMRPSQPTRISIPNLNLRAGIVEVGKADDGSIAPPGEDPTGTAGWYGLGPTPGEVGTAVIVGHVDTSTGPAVFAKLHELRRGMAIEVKRQDRRTAKFEVDSVETFPKTAFPAQRVLAHSDTAQLALVTCGGEWVGGHTGYADNVIVFAHLT